MPLTVGQEEVIERLYWQLQSAEDMGEVILETIQDLAFSLFSHMNTDHTADKYFSAVNCFLVLSSVRPDGQFKMAGEITQVIAALVYCNRTAMLNHAQGIMGEQKIGLKKQVVIPTKELY
jgi:hypothetical protein